MNLLDLLHAQTRDPYNLRGRIASVIAVGPGSLSVDLDDGLGGRLADVPTSALYRDATVDDVVLVTIIGSAWIALAPLSRGGAVYPNVLRNPALESDPIGVLPSDTGGTASREDEPYGLGIFWVNAPPAGSTAIVGGGEQHSGSRCYRLTLRDGTDWYAVPESGVSKSDPLWPNVAEAVEPIAVATGQVWRIGVWARASATLPGALQLKCGWDDATLDGLSPTWSLSATPTTSWRYYQALYTVPAGKTLVTPTWSVSGFSATGVTGKYVFLDDFVAQRVS